MKSNRRHTSHSPIAPWFGLLAALGCSALAGVALGSEFQSVIRATTYFKGGEHYGFRLYPKTDADLATFESWGFEPGDLLVKVNGRRLANPPAPTELYEMLDRGDVVVVTIQRGDELMDVSVQSP
jgi:type II secretory pathway component PulC